MRASASIPQKGLPTSSLDRIAAASFEQVHDCPPRNGDGEEDKSAGAVWDKYFDDADGCGRIGRLAVG
jgi:hypothetical protein